MKRFEKIGVVERHEFPDGRAHYEKASKAHHGHLIDTATGRVIEFRSAEIERLQEEIAQRLGFRLVGHRLELYGVPAAKAAHRTRPCRQRGTDANSFPCYNPVRLLSRE
jgi:Fur family ferric uptake transcriptional regulator